MFSIDERLLGLLQVLFIDTFTVSLYRFDL